MRRRRALYSSSSDQPWYQNSSDAQRAANSANSGPTAQWHWTAIYDHLPYSNAIHHLRVLKFAFEPILQISHIELLFEQKLFACHINIFLVIGIYVSTHNLLYHDHGQGNNTLDYNCQDDRIHVDSPVSTSTKQDITSTTSKTHSSAATSSIGAVAGGGGHGSLLVSPKGSSKHSAAIAGGMTGSLAGMALIGLLFLFLFRRRKRRPPYNEKHEAAAEPRMSSSSQALPSAIAAAGAPRHSDRSIVPQRSPSGRPPIIDHNLIHMDLNHWDRPFAHEDPHPRDDSSPLRLMNPDPTPTPPIILTASSSVSPENNPHRFLQRQRSALAAALLSVKRSLSSQDVVPRHASEESHTHTSAHPSAHPSPLHIQDKSNKLTMPSEVILAGASVTESRPMSSQSAISDNTIIRHHAPDDPFVSSVSVRSGPFDLASASVVDGDVGREGERVILQRNGAERVVLPRDGADRVIMQGGQREQTPNWEVHVYPGT
ncbi:unnamed protein product, partial [Aureobasidium pullulans]